MNALPAVLKDSSGAQIRLGREIGKGGEGAVFEAQDRSDVAVKLYWPTKVGDRRDKVGAMVAAAWSKSNAFVAYPIDAVYTPAGAFAGFTMRRIAGHKPVHLLYSPSSRKLEFSGASFRFLIHAALNAARAVASVHTTNCVIGDVNHSGFLVSEKATITLIDSDSFQVIAAGKNFLCQVGTPEYTPPELQNSRFDRVSRTGNHDNFGLAVLIFQLLFMGRHPYSGRFNGPGDMPLERAIAEFRFAYSARQTTAMSPPPNAPLLSDFPSYISEAFENAFGPDGVRDRPKPDKWVELLSRLEGDTQKCSTKPSHDHVRGSACPWCRMEQAHPGFVAFISKTAVRDLPIAIDTKQALALIASIKDPGPVPDIQTVLVVSAHQAAQAQLRFDVLTMRHAAALGASLIGFLLWQWDAPAFMAILISGSGGATSWYPDKRVNALAEARRQAEQAWRAIQRAWSQQSGNTNYQQAKSEALSFVRDLNSLPAAESSQLQQLEANKRNLQLERHLERHLLKAAKIPKIGSARKAVLASFGIETAADIERHRVASIQGFGPGLVSELLNWRSGIEQRFTFNPKEPTSPAEIAAVKTALASKKLALEAKLRSAVTRLQQVAALSIDQRNSLGASANATFMKFKEALSAERATRPILTRVSKIVSASCMGLLLLNLFSAQHPSGAPPSIRTSDPSLIIPLRTPAGDQLPSNKQQTSTNVSPPVSKPAPSPIPLSQEREGNNAIRRSELPATGSFGPSSRPPLGQQLPTTAPPPEADHPAATLPPPIEILAPSAKAGPQRAGPRFNPSTPADAARIQQRLLDLGYLQTPPDGKWGQRSTRALQEFRTARGLKSDVAWDQQTEDELLSASIPARPARNPPSFVGEWRDEHDMCGNVHYEAPLRITSERAETVAGRCDFDSVEIESEGVWRIRARCSANGDKWQANIQLRVTGQRMVWNSERGRTEYLRCR
jgi:DNA-binding helix-hairpin-helix protein with protein kinase domain